MPTYKESPTDDSLLKKIKEKNYPLLKEVAIKIIMREELSIPSNGRATVAQTVRVDDRNYLLHKTEILVEISHEIWDKLHPDSREIVLDHQLAFIGVGVDQNGAPKREENGRHKLWTTKPDIIEFKGVHSRRGPYQATLNEEVDKIVQELKA